MGRNFVWCPTRLSLWCSVVQNVLRWLFYIDWYRHASYTSGNTPYFIRKDINEVAQSLEGNSLKHFQWFENNQMDSNKDKCYFLKSNKINVSIRTDNEEIDNTEYAKLSRNKLDAT